MTARIIHIRLLLGVALLGGPALAGCAQQPAPERPAAAGTVTPTGTVTQEATVTPSPSSAHLPLPSGGPGLPPGAKGQPVSLTGVVEKVELEGGCTVLRVGTKAYELKGGDPAVLKAGARLVVRGVIRTDLVTVCQLGPVLEVLATQPA